MFPLEFSLVGEKALFEFYSTNRIPFCLITLFSIACYSLVDNPRFIFLFWNHITQHFIVRAKMRTVTLSNKMAAMNDQNS